MKVAYTRRATYNILGMTIHSALAIPKDCCDTLVSKLDSYILDKLSNFTTT